jgi:hypothetical protein
VAAVEEHGVAAGQSALVFLAPGDLRDFRHVKLLRLRRCEEEQVAVPLDAHPDPRRGVVRLELHRVPVRHQPRPGLHGHGRLVFVLVPLLRQDHAGAAALGDEKNRLPARRPRLLHDLAGADHDAQRRAGLVEKVRVHGERRILIDRNGFRVRAAAADQRIQFPFPRIDADDVQIDSIGITDAADRAILEVGFHGLPFRRAVTVGRGSIGRLRLALLGVCGRRQTQDGEEDSMGVFHARGQSQAMCRATYRPVCARRKVVLLQQLGLLLQISSVRWSVFCPCVRQ